MQPEQNINELFAFFAIARQQKILHYQRIISNAQEGVDVQVDFTNQVIEKFHELLKQ